MKKLFFAINNRLYIMDKNSRIFTKNTANMNIEETRDAICVYFNTENRYNIKIGEGGSDIGYISHRLFGQHKTQFRVQNTPYQYKGAENNNHLYIAMEGIAYMKYFNQFQFSKIIPLEVLLLNLDSGINVFSLSDFSYYLFMTENQNVSWEKIEKQYQSSGIDEAYLNADEYRNLKVNVIADSKEYSNIESRLDYIKLQCNFIQYKDIMSYANGIDLFFKDKISDNYKSIITKPFLLGGIGLSIAASFFLFNMYVSNSSENSTLTKVIKENKSLTAQYKTKNDGLIPYDYYKIIDNNIINIGDFYNFTEDLKIISSKIKTQTKTDFKISYSEKTVNISFKDLPITLDFYERISKEFTEKPLTSVDGKKFNITCTIDKKPDILEIKINYVKN